MISPVKKILIREAYYLDYPCRLAICYTHYCNLLIWIYLFLCRCLTQDTLHHYPLMTSVVEGLCQGLSLEAAPGSLNFFFFYEYVLLLWNVLVFSTGLFLH